MQAKMNYIPYVPPQKLANMTISKFYAEHLSLSMPALIEDGADNWKAMTDAKI